MRAVSTMLSVLAAMTCVAGSAEERPASQVAIGALSLPADADGMFHMRTGSGSSKPLQLSLRYFSAPQEVPGGVLQIFKEPVPAVLPTPPPSPLLTVRIPETSRHAYLVIWSAPDAQGKPVWQSMLLDGADWPDSSMKLLNATGDGLEIDLAGKRVKLPAGKSTNLRAADHPESFPVGIHRLASPPEPIFSSTWRISAGQRELCVLFPRDRSISLRSLMAVDAPPPP
jgi:hypothetical protein